MNPRLVAFAVVFSGAFWLLVGCSLMRGRIALPGVSVQAPKDNGTPAQVAQSSAGTAIALAAGSVVTVTKFEAVAATKDAPAQPAREVTEIRPSAPTEYHQTESKTAASTGTVSTAIREHEIDVEAKKPLLYASIFCALVAGFFVYRDYPTPAICAGAASVVFFLAWHIDLPGWIAALALAAVVGGGFLYIGHERGLKTPTP